MVVDEDQLTLCIGYFLRVCPGLNKTTIGELLGEPDKFNLKVGTVDGVRTPSAQVSIFHKAPSMLHLGGWGACLPACC